MSLLIALAGWITLSIALSLIFGPVLGGGDAAPVPIQRAPRRKNTAGMV